MSNDERKAKIEDQLKNMAGAPVRRKRRVIKPLSKTPTPQPAGVSFTSMDDGGCPSDGCPSEGAEMAASPIPVTAEDTADAQQQQQQEEEMPVLPRRRRRVIKPLSKVPTAQPTAVEFTTVDEGAATVATSTATATVTATATSPTIEEEEEEEEEEPVRKPEPGSAEEFFSKARNVRGYQSARHSTESAHERINAQLAGLHRKKIIRARARGETLDPEPATGGGGVTKGGVEPQPRSKAARFYGGVGLQLEESTPERFLRLAKLAKEWREQKSKTPWHSYASAYSAPDEKKPSAKELLQAAVEGVALGACT